MPIVITDEERKLMKAAAYVEATYYMKYTRLQETAAFAKKMKYKKIGIGLCVGHDALFARACNGPVTTLVVKDRVLAHNPISVAYSGYWKKKLKLEE